MKLRDLIRPVSRLWYAYHLSQGAGVPRPRGSASVRIGGAGARRVLLLGNGPCHGWGVVDHGIALTGKLAAEIARRSRTATQVDYVGDEIMSVASAREWLRSSDPTEVDAVVVVIGVNDAVRLTREDSWRRDYLLLLDDFEARIDPSTPIVVTGMQPPSSVPAYSGVLGSLADAHARRLNEVLEDVAASRPRTTYLALASPTAGMDRGFGSPQMYEAWAEPLSKAVVSALSGARLARDAGVLRDTGAVSEPETTSRDTAEQPTAVNSTAADSTPEVLPVVLPAGSWIGLGEAMRRAESNDLDALSLISAEARERFGVGIATVTLVEGERARYLGGAGGNMPTSVPLELTHCSHVVDGDRALVVPNSPKDPRFAANPMLDLTHIQFYAGHPIRSSAGETIGTFCLMDGFPKREQQIDVLALGEFAARAERELWKLEPAGDR